MTQSIVKTGGASDIGQMLETVIQKADSISPESFVGAIERLARLQAEMFERDDKIRFRNALTSWKENMPKIIRQRVIEDKEGNERYRVVALEDVADPVMNSLVQYGITYRYKTIDLPDGRIRTTCILGLKDTAYEEEGATLSAPPDTSGGKDALKAIGSTTSYLEKYTLIASLGMHVYGDDPEAAAQRKIESQVGVWIERIGSAQDVKQVNQLVMEAIKAVRGEPNAVQSIGRAKAAWLKGAKGEAD